MELGPISNLMLFLSFVLPINLSTSKDKNNRNRSKKLTESKMSVRWHLAASLHGYKIHGMAITMHVTVPTASIVGVISSSFSIYYHSLNDNWFVCIESHHHEETALCICLLCSYVGPSSLSPGSTGRFFFLLSISNHRWPRPRQKVTEGGWLPTTELCRQRESWG